jgi:GTP-dependent phosphoenolpyruvate carboxykinase
MREYMERLRARGELLEVRREEWLSELDGHKKFLDQFGGRLSPEMWKQYEALKGRLKEAVAA